MNFKIKLIVEGLLKSLSGKIKIQEKDNNELKQVHKKTTETNKVFIIIIVMII